MTDTKTPRHETQDDKPNNDVRDRAAQALTGAKDAVQRAGEELEANPLAVLVGGLAVGALAGALLPRSAREKELLAPVGKRLGETARQAIAAAKDAGKQELDAAGLTPGAARDRGKEVFGGLSKALSSAGTAATQAARQGQGEGRDGTGTTQA